MFRMRRTVAAMACALALVAGACGSDDDDESTSETTAGSAGGTAGACEGSDAIKIGLLAPMTGGNAQSAKQVENSAKLAVGVVNAEGALGDRQVELKVYDTENLPDVATQQAQRAITQDGVDAIAGPWSTTEALAVADVVEREGVVNINYSAATETITADRTFVFRTSPITGDLAAGLVSVALALEVDNAVLLYGSGGFGQGAVDPITAAAEEAGLDLAAKVQFTDSASDVSAEVATAARSNPGAILLASSTGADSGLIGKAMAEQGLNVPLIGFSPIALPDAIQIAGEAYNQLPGVYTLSTADGTNPHHLELLEAYADEYGELDGLPEQALGVYDAVRWIGEGLAATGCESGEALASALETLPPREGVNGRAGSEQFFEAGDHDAHDTDYLVPYKLDDGELVQDTSLEL